MTDNNKKLKQIREEAKRIGELYNDISTDAINTLEGRSRILDTVLFASGKDVSEQFAGTVSYLLEKKIEMDDESGSPSTAARLSNVMKTLRGGFEQPK